MPAESTTPKPKLRQLHPSPRPLVTFLLAVEGFLFLSDWLHWLPKGWAVLLAIATVALMMVAMIYWYLFALLFHRHYQFTIRLLLLLTTAVAIPFSWLAVEMQQA